MASGVAAGPPRDLLCSGTAHWPSLAKRQDAACRCVLEERYPPDAREPADWSMWRSRSCNSCDSCSCKSWQVGLCRISATEGTHGKAPTLTALPYLEAPLYPELLKITLLIAQKSPSGDIQLGSGRHVVFMADTRPGPLERPTIMVTSTTRLVVNWPAYQSQD